MEKAQPTKPPAKKKRELVVRKKPNPTATPAQVQAPTSAPPTRDYEKEYLEQLSETEKIALKIAHQQLESSFCIEKSIGFLNYLEKVNSK